MEFASYKSDKHFINEEFCTHVHEKCLKEISHEVNVNKNHNELQVTICTRMTKIKKTKSTKCSEGSSRAGSCIHFWLECKMLQPLWKFDYFLKN